jgi:hypothetical protein
MEETELKTLLLRSDALQEQLAQVLYGVKPSDPSVLESIWTMVVVVHEHAASLRMLIQTGMGNSALSLMRVLFDAVVRQMWAGYCATPEQLKRLNGVMSHESLQSSLGLPMTNEMLAHLQREGPPALHRLLNEFKVQSSKPLNSVVHTGLHALQIAKSGLPLTIASQVVKQSNNLLHMSAYQVALFTQCLDTYESVNAVTSDFKDCFQMQ